MDTGTLKGKPLVIPIDSKCLQEKYKRQALDSVNIIKEKRYFQTKERTCDNDIRQEKYLKEGENISPPMVSLEAMFTTLFIDMYSGRNITTFDVPEA